MDIRLANEGDIEDIMDLYEELFLSLSIYEPEYIKASKQDKDFISRTISDAKYDLFVAVEDKVIGFMIIEEQESPPYNCFVRKKIGYIMDLCVSENHRRKGIGSLLIDRGVEWAKERNLDCVELTVLDRNRSAKVLYEEIGFRSKSSTMTMEIG